PRRETPPPFRQRPGRFGRRTNPGPRRLAALRLLSSSNPSSELLAGNIRPSEWPRAEIIRKTTNQNTYTFYLVRLFNIFIEPCRTEVGEYIGDSSKRAPLCGGPDGSGRGEGRPCSSRDRSRSS